MKKKKLEKGQIANLGIILGQMSHCQPAAMGGISQIIVDRKVFDAWKETLEEILNENIK